MNSRGFTLVELLTVIVIIGVLTAIVTVNFNQYTVKSQISNQTRELYGNLMEYRSKAFYEKKNWTFMLAAGGYGIYSSPTVDADVLPVTSVTFSRPFVTNVGKIVFTGQGFTNNTGTMCAAETSGAPVDAVVIATTRVQIGKKEGADCASDKIDAK